LNKKKEAELTINHSPCFELRSSGGGENERRREERPLMVPSPTSNILLIKSGTLTDFVASLMVLP
jgi:hypothetical protein